MTEVPKFKFANFSPRKTVAKKINDRLNLTLDWAPSDSNCTATISREGDRFFFEVTIRSTQGLFTAYKEFDMKNQPQTDRTWQIGVVDELCQDILLELKQWQKSRPFMAA